MLIDLDYDSSTANAPAGFSTALAYAADALDALITNDITVTIEVGWNEIGGVPLGRGDLAEGGDSPGIDVTYGQLIADLEGQANNLAARQELASLPANAASQLAGQSLFVTSAQEKAWGLLAPDAGGVDGAVGFGSAYAYATDPSDQAVPGEYGLVGVAEHEITHALGRMEGLGAFDLTDYSAPGVLNTSGGGGYYSIDGGATDLRAFASASQDPGDWASAPGDSFNYTASAGVPGTISVMDRTLLETIGFSVAQTDFLVADETTGTSAMQNGVPYSGPVAGLTDEFVYAGSDNLDITAYAADVFIHTGSGDDAIDVSRSGGNDVVDGSTGSNFITGGAGDDTFYVDDRDATAPVWSTVVGFHSGDSVVVWGVTPSDFSVDWLDGQGAPGATGLTAGFTAAGKPDANVTLAGWSSESLGSALVVSYGTTQNEPGLPGSSYMMIRAV